ncbi:MAG: hypothetical protein L0J77_13030 [Marinobacter sp.]|nr:hypothetical protein [Marinobacter sp.]
MKNLQHLAEKLRANTGAMMAITELYEDMRGDFEANSDAPKYITGFTLGGLERAIHVLAESTAATSDDLANEINEKAGQK